METDLYAWQEKVIAECVERPKRALFAAPRLGKTRATSIMSDIQGFDRNLVVAPLSVCGDWCRELALQGHIVLPFYQRGLVGAGKGIYEHSRGTVVLNYDKLPGLEQPLRGWKPQGQVYDESHLLKNPQSARSKSARKLAGKAEFVRILTGTPSPNHYGDLWAQMTLVNPQRWESWTKFSQRYLIRHAIYPSKIIGYNSLEELQAMLMDDADIVRREDVFGPDTYQYVERWVDLPRKAREVYDTLVKEWLYYHEEGEVLADHALKRLVRLQQLTSGYLRTEDEKDIPVHTAKIDAVLADLEEIVASEEKAVLFHRFTWEGESYSKAISERYPSTPVVHISGQSKPADRDAAIQCIREYNGAAICIAQTRTAALGVSFAEATHALFVSESFSFTDEEQARDRVYKPGFNRCITHYRANGTVDEFIAGVIGGKADIHNAITHADVRSIAFGTRR